MNRLRQIGLMGALALLVACPAWAGGKIDLNQSGGGTTELGGVGDAAKVAVEGAPAQGAEGNLINSAVGDATSAAFALPTGYKTITGRITGAGAVAQVITIYGGTSSGMVAATSDVVCTITLSGTSGAAGTADSCPPFIAPFLYYIAVTSGSSGTPTTILTASY